jgi:hypothetical protein
MNVYTGSAAHSLVIGTADGDVGDGDCVEVDVGIGDSLYEKCDVCLDVRVSTADEERAEWWCTQDHTHFCVGEKGAAKVIDAVEDVLAPTLSALFGVMWAVEGVRFIVLGSKLH